VKDVVQELVADGEVLSDKIGVTTFYWSFPSEAINKVWLASSHYSTYAYIPLFILRLEEARY